MNALSFEPNYWAFKIEFTSRLVFGISDLVAVSTRGGTSTYFTSVRTRLTF